MPNEELLAKMGQYNEELMKSKVLLAGEGLKASSFGKRVRFIGESKKVINGPFPEIKELISGYWIWQVGSIEEALEWARRCPNPMLGEESEIEIRPIYETEDFGNELTPELREREERIQE